MLTVKRSDRQKICSRQHLDSREPPFQVSSQTKIMVSFGCHPESETIKPEDLIQIHSNFERRFFDVFIHETWDLK